MTCETDGVHRPRRGRLDVALNSPSDPAAWGRSGESSQVPGISGLPPARHHSSGSSATWSGRSSVC
jgi:hypothetical protein